jgi:hypothetical protein
MIILIDLTTGFMAECKCPRNKQKGMTSRTILKINLYINSCLHKGHPQRLDCSSRKENIKTKQIC